ncbi:MAG: response regulator [Bdellovibrionales bacterium]|nr:response regulator [Bdellovibrionales bacterium]
MSSKKKSILVIDDDITSLDIVSFLFEERGYHVERCADGYAAIEYVKAETPDLVIVDLMMPKINGVDTVRELRSLGVVVPVIAFTAVDEPELHQEAVGAGCDRVLTKPCRPEKLVEHIKALLPS